MTQERSAVRENSAIALAMIASSTTTGATTTGTGTGSTSSTAKDEVAAAAHLEAEAEEELSSAWDAAASSVLGSVLASDANKFVHGFVHETVTRLAVTSRAMGEVLAVFEASPRWRPPHYQVETGFVSAPSEFLFANDLDLSTGQVFDDSNGLR